MDQKHPQHQNKKPTAIRSRAVDNRIPLSFDQAIDVLLSVDPKKLPPAVRPGKTKAKKRHPAKRHSHRGAKK